MTKPILLALALSFTFPLAGCDALGALGGGKEDTKKKAASDEEDDSDDAPKKKKSKKASADDATDEKPAAGGKEFAAPTSWDPPPLTAGSFSRSQKKEGGAVTGHLVVKVLSVEGQNTRIEVEAPSPGSPTVVQALIRVKERKSPAGLEILEAKLKAPGAAAPMVLSGPTLTMSQQILNNQLSVFTFPDWVKNTRREDVTTPAGTFRQAMVVDQEATIMGIKSKMRSWYHPAVAVNGIVKQEGEVDGKPALYEVVEFGTSGAKSAL